jgi:hypothetical protein
MSAIKARKKVIATYFLKNIRINCFKIWALFGRSDKIRSKVIQSKAQVY